MILSRHRAEFDAAAISATSGKPDLNFKRPIFLPPIPDLSLVEVREEEEAEPPTFPVVGAVRECLPQVLSGEDHW